MANPDDPFACFGDDGDSDSDSDGMDNGDADDDDGCAEEAAIHQRGKKAKTSSSAADLDRARNLVEAYNAKADEGDDDLPSGPSSTSHDKGAAQQGTTTPSFRSSYDDQRSRTSSLPWPLRPPLYLGPMALRDELPDEGGGRGYVATEDLPPGTCVLIEEPLVEGWSERQLGKRLGLESIRYILERDDAERVVRCMEELHPRKEVADRVLERREQREGGSSSSANDDAEEAEDLLHAVQIADMMSDMDGDPDHARQAEELAEHAARRDVTNSDGTPLASRDANRLLLALRYNGFDSGLYLHFSMFNHSEDPNCVKFRPGGEEGGDGRSGAATTTTRRRYSEARTTRRVREGEALTLHYLENPREACHATRRRALWDQHRFDIGDEDGYKRFLDANATKTGHLFNDNERGNAVFESELVGGKFPPSSVLGGGDGEEGDAPVTTNIEKSLDDLEDMLEELKGIPAATADDDGAADQKYFDRAAALELTIWELIAASRTALSNDKHILLSRCRRTHLDAVELLLSRHASTLTRRQSNELTARFVPSARALLESQRLRLGDDHPDVARTCHDLSMGMGALLSHSPKRLLSLRLEGMETLGECSRTEGRCRAEKERIEGMYPRDAEHILRSVRKDG